MMGDEVDDIAAIEARLRSAGWADPPDHEPLPDADFEWFWYGSDWWIVKVEGDALVARGDELEELQREVRKLKDAGHGVRRNRRRDKPRTGSPVTAARR